MIRRALKRAFATCGWRPLAMGLIGVLLLALVADQYMPEIEKQGQKIARMERDLQRMQQKLKLQKDVEARLKQAQATLATRSAGSYAAATPEAATELLRKDVQAMLQQAGINNASVIPQPAEAQGQINLVRAEILFTGATQKAVAVLEKLQSSAKPLKVVSTELRLNSSQAQALDVSIVVQAAHLAPPAKRS